MVPRTFAWTVQPLTYRDQVLVSFSDNVNDAMAGIGTFGYIILRQTEQSSWQTWNRWGLAGRLEGIPIPEPSAATLVASICLCGVLFSDAIKRR